MNRIFAGRAMGVKPITEKILPKVLEEKHFLKNKSVIAKEKFANGKMKIKGLGSFKEKLNLKSNFKTNLKGNNHKTLNIKPNFNQNIKLMKGKSNLFLNTKYAGVKNKRLNYVKTKMDFYAGKLKPKKKPLIFSDLKSKNKLDDLINPSPDFDTTVANADSNMRFQNQQPSLQNRYGLDNAINYADKARLNRMADELSPPKPQPIDPTKQNIMTLNKHDNYNEDVKYGAKAVNFVKNKIKNSSFMKNFEYRNKLKHAKSQAKEEFYNDNKNMERYKSNIYNNLSNRRLIEDFQENNDDSKIQQLGMTALAAKNAIHQVIPQMDSGKFRRLAGFKVGEGFRYTAAMGAARRTPAALKIAEYTSSRKRPVSPEMYRMYPNNRMPQYNELNNMPYNELQKRYLRATIDKRINSNRYIGEKGMNKLARDSERLQNAHYAVDAYEGRKLKHALSPEQIAVATKMGYDLDKVSPKFLKTVNVDGKQMHYNVYGKLVSKSRGRYNKANVIKTPLIVYDKPTFN